MTRASLPPLLQEVASKLLPLEHNATVDSTRHPQLNAAAVLILFFPQGHGASFLLTARPHTMNSHPGQISLPGGRVEIEDDSLLRTALRETEEELGVSIADIVPLGRLETFHMFRSGYAITPFVAWAPRLPALHPQPKEVEEVIVVPIECLLDSSLIREETWEYNGRDWRITFFQFEGHQVWGATARVLDDLAQRLGAGASPLRYRPGDVHPLDDEAQ